LRVDVHKVVLVMRSQCKSQFLFALLVIVSTSIVELLDNLTYLQLCLVERKRKTNVFEAVSKYFLTRVVWHEVEVQIHLSLWNGNIHSHEMLDLLGCCIAVETLHRAFILAEEEVLDYRLIHP
jgi:hypothetical protein